MSFNLLVSIFLFSSGGFQPHCSGLSVKQQPSTPSGVSKSYSVKDQKAQQDTTFTLKIENEKRVADEALKAKLVRDIKMAIANNHLAKPYKIAMGFTKGARDVETFLFGEQIFYLLAEGGYTISGKPLELPEITPNPVPQIKVIDKVIYVVLSKM